ncbi:hypothetical protein PUN28_013859 [Cardiocondyla obscurior]|uniref:Cytochrome P450 9e2 n=1 Tax=Cardiocondyla obscurior TaxID=286306 RepID=A0AAW2F9D7_9HYME
MLYIILSVIVGALSFYYFFFKNSNYFKKHGIPYIRPLPILGNTGSSFLHLQSMAEIIKNIYDLQPKAKYVGIYDMLQPIVMIRDPELIKSIALKHFDIFSDRKTFVVDEKIDPLFGKNLFALQGEKWRQVRSLLSPAFTSSKMKAMFKLMSDYGADFSNYLMHLPPGQRTLHMKDIFTRYTNDVIATCAFGINVDSMREPDNEFYVNGREATSVNVATFTRFYIAKILPWLARLLNIKIVREKIAKYFRNLIQTTIKTRDDKGIVRPDMLQLMMENRGKEGKVELSADDMVAQAFIFFFGGFESTSMLMCFATYEIAVNEDVQKKLQSEIDQILEETNGQITYEAINNTEYLDAVINEALRKYPIALITDRCCTKDFELEPTLPGTKPFTIKAGSTVWIPIHALHYDTKYFENPEKFDPSRFLGEQKKRNLNSGTYLPFGLGPRMCIGNRFALLEMKALLFHLLARCDLKICEKTPIPLKLAKVGFGMRIENDFCLRVVPRSNMHHTLASNLANRTNTPGASILRGWMHTKLEKKKKKYIGASILRGLLHTKLEEIKKKTNTP